jgi:hypothetical protein
MRQFPFDIQYLCINFKMAPVKEGGSNSEGEDSFMETGDTVGEFQHPKMAEWLVKRGNDDELIVLRPHFPDSRMDKLTEWDILRVQGRPIPTNTEALALSKVYDGFQVVIIVSREWINACLNLALLLFFNVLLSFTAYAVPAEDFSDRMEITLTLFLSAMAFKFTANQKLPPVNYLTFMDKYILLGFSLMAVQCIGFWIISRAEGDISAEEYVYYSYNATDNTKTITGAIVRGSLNAAADMANQVGGATVWIFDFPWTDDTVQLFDSIMFVILVGIWLGFSMVFIYKAIRFEYFVRVGIESPDNALWSHFANREDLDEFEANKINKKGRDHYRHLKKEVQGEWLKELLYGRAPRILQIDCRSEAGRLVLYTFNGIVSCDKEFKTLNPRFRERLYTWVLGSWVTESLYDSISDWQHSGKLGIWASDAKAQLGAEATIMEDEITMKRFIKHLDPDGVVATLPVNLSDLKNTKQDTRQDEVHRFFSRMNVKVDKVDAVKKGRMEALAVRYASIRHILPMPGVIINVCGRHIRITSTKNKTTYVIRRGWKDLTEAIHKMHENHAQNDGKISPFTVTDLKEKFEKAVKPYKEEHMAPLKNSKAEIKQQALSGIIGIDKSYDCWKLCSGEKEVLFCPVASLNVISLSPPFHSTY